MTETIRTAARRPRWALILGLGTAAALGCGWGMLAAVRQWPPYSSANALFDRLARHAAAEPPADPLWSRTAPSDLIRLRTPEQVAARRARLIAFLWGAEGLPLNIRPELEPDLDGGAFGPLTNLARVDRLRVVMDHGIDSRIYHFIPRRSRGRALIYHEGHSGPPESGRNVIAAFLADGYDVLALAMPLSGGNSQPEVEVPGAGWLRLAGHEALSLFEIPGQPSPVRWFLTPVCVAINHLLATRAPRSIAMTGRSSGGWTAVLYAACDPRVTAVYPVAGTCPLYLRRPLEWGDYEQSTPPLYRLANELELYLMATTVPARRQIQFFNRFDPSVYNGDRFKTYQPAVQTAVAAAGGGRFEVVIDDSQREHATSPAAIARIKADLASALPTGRPRERDGR